MIPERSVIGKSAKSVFFEDINDIDVYVEDTGYGAEKIYNILFSRALSSRFRVSKVFPLGGRDEVIEQHRLSAANAQRPTLYVIDGDFSLLLEEGEECEPGLFRLPCYCIENIIIDPNSIHDFLYEEDPVHDREYLAFKFGFDGWVDENCDDLIELFIEYATSFSLNKDQQTVGFPVNRLVADGSGRLNIEAVQVRIDLIREKSIETAGEDVYWKERERIASKMPEDPSLRLDYISGKDYLFPLVKMRMKTVVKTKVSDVNLKLRLALKCNTERLSGALEKIIP